MAVGPLDKPTGPTGILSSNRTPPPSKGTKHMPGKPKGLVGPAKPLMKGRR